MGGTKHLCIPYQDKILLLIYRNIKQSLKRRQTIRLWGPTKICVSRQYKTKDTIDNCGTVNT